jgi:hypothetical protein
MLSSNGDAVPDGVQQQQRRLQQLLSQATKKAMREQSSEKRNWKDNITGTTHGNTTKHTKVRGAVDLSSSEPTVTAMSLKASAVRYGDALLMIINRSSSSLISGSFAKSCRANQCRVACTRMTPRPIAIGLSMITWPNSYTKSRPQNGVVFNDIASALPNNMVVVSGKSKKIFPSQAPNEDICPLLVIARSVWLLLASGSRNMGPTMITKGRQDCHDESLEEDGEELER